MTDKELRRLKRAELLEILYYLQKENEELKAELEQRKAEADQPKPQPVQIAGGLPEDFMQQITTAVQEAVANAPSKKSSRKKRR